MAIMDQAREALRPTNTIERVPELVATALASVPPPGAPGLVIVNPPYGTRIGDKKPLFALYGALGTVLKTRFSGWRVGIVTTDRALARATALPFLAPAAPVLHGGLKDWFDAQGLTAHVSVTDETDYAASFCIVEKIGT